jgi:hypothetical protein
MGLLGEVVSGRVRRSANVVSRVVADEAIVVPIRRGAADLDSIYTFNETGTKLWSLIEKGLEPAALISHLQAQYGLSAEQATLDAESFLKELADEGLVEPA